MNASMLLSRRRVSLFSQVFLGGPRSPPPPLSFERGSFRRRRCPQPLISSYEDAVRSGVNASWAIVAAMSSPRPRMPPVARVSLRAGVLARRSFRRPAVGCGVVALASLALAPRVPVQVFLFKRGGRKLFFIRYSATRSPRRERATLAFGAWSKYQFRLVSEKGVAFFASDWRESDYCVNENRSAGLGGVPTVKFPSFSEGKSPQCDFSPLRQRSEGVQAL